MDGYLILVIIILVVLYFVISKRKKQSTGNSVNTESSDKGSDYSQNYAAQFVQRAGLQSLESIHIVGTSNALDTIKGRFDLLKNLHQQLKSASISPRYITDIQKAIDLYKSMYYEQIPQDYALAFVTHPNQFDLNDFYCICLFESLKRNIENHLEEIGLLKREDAKLRRKEKVKELIAFVKTEVTDSCSQTKSYPMVMKEIQMLEDQFASGKITITVSPVNITNSYNGDTQEEVKKLQVAQTTSPSSSDEFVVNKGAPFVLTIIGDKEASKKVKTLLDDGNLYDNDKTDKLLALFATYNLRVKEIEEYKRKYGSVYFFKLEELKKASAEYSLAGERDKEDLLEGFREIAIEDLYEHANCNLEVLFEKEPTDFTIDDVLIKDYGFKNIQTYIRYADDMNKIRVFPSDHYSRSNFETLVELKLAIRGSAIPLEELLFTLSLKDLNELAGNPEKQYKRKNQAVEYILTIPNIEEKIGRKISLRELFKLQPLPEKYAHISLQNISDSWRYLFEVIHLLIDTHRTAFYSLEAMKNKEYAKGFKVECWNNENVICPHSKDFINKKYSLNKPPSIPVHIGCNCMLRQEYDF